MKKTLSLVLSLALAMTSFSPCQAQSGDPEIIPLEINPPVDPGPFKAPEVFPVSCGFSHILNELVISFSSYLGDVTLEVANTTAGMEVQEVLDSSQTLYNIPISGTTGLYTVTITLSGGVQYCGSFEL